VSENNGVEMLMDLLEIHRENPECVAAIFAALAPLAICAWACACVSRAESHLDASDQ